MPTFTGIEPPELFDRDHRLLTRTTNFMVHGRAVSGGHTVAYGPMTGNDERAPGWRGPDAVAAQPDDSVLTADLRAGYAIETSGLEVTPYAQYDFHSDPEINREKDFGGDDDEMYPELHVSRSYIPGACRRN